MYQAAGSRRSPPGRLYAYDVTAKAATQFPLRSRSCLPRFHPFVRRSRASSASMPRYLDGAHQQVTEQELDCSVLGALGHRSMLLSFGASNACPYAEESDRQFRPSDARCAHFAASKCGRLRNSTRKQDPRSKDALSRAREISTTRISRGFGQFGLGAVSLDNRAPWPGKHLVPHITRAGDRRNPRNLLSRLPS